MSWFSSYFSSKPSSASDIDGAPIPQTQPIAVSSIQISNKSEPELPPTQPKPPQVERPNRNKVITGAGIAFFAVSLLITRRAFVRRRLASNPAFYTNAPGHHAELSKKVSGAKEALEAFNLATLNVLSVSMIAVGGSLWALDINNMADARRLLRGGLGVDGTGKTEQEAEEEFEEWMATVLARKEAKTGVPSRNTDEGSQQR